MILQQLDTDAPELAQAGAIIADGGSAAAARDVITGANPPAGGGEWRDLDIGERGALARLSYGGAFVAQPEDGIRTETAARNIARVRMAAAGIDPAKNKDQAKAIFSQALKEASGALTIGGDQYGGIAAYGKGWFSGGKQTMVPAGVKADKFLDVIHAIRDEDLAGLKSPPQTNGRLFRARDLQSAWPVAVAGGYRFAAGDPAGSDPQWIPDKDGQPFVLDIAAMLPQLRTRVPGAFWGLMATLLYPPRLDAFTPAEPIVDPEERAASGKRLFDAADRLQTYVDNTFARERALEWAYAQRNRAIEAATGEKLDNPMIRPDPVLTGGSPEDIMGALAPSGPMGGPSVTERESAWRERIAALAAKFPDKRDIIRPDVPIAGEAGALAQIVEKDFADALHGPGLDTADRVAHSIVGSLAGSFRDPLQVASLAIGGGAGAGKTIVARIGQAVAREAVLNGGVVAAMQIRAQAWRKEAGLANGIGEAAKNVGMAALFGGALGGTLAAGREFARAFRAGPEVADAFERVHNGNPRPGDVETLARAGNRPLTPEERGTIAAAEAGDADAATVAATRPAGMSAEAGDVALAGATRHAEAPDFVPPPDIVPLRRAERTPEVGALVDEMAPGRKVTIAGKPVTFGSFDAGTLGSDAATFQYKSGGDAAGVTDRLQNVRQWDATASGKAFIFEREDGTRVVADGHQRLGLARRVMEGRPDAHVDLDGYLFRAADGWTPADVRALAAKKNLQEGSGTALDAARILRDRPDVMDASLPTTTPMMRQATALARLSDAAWGMTVNGVVPENYAAAVGAMVPNRDIHAAVLADLARFQPETERAARLMIAESMRSTTVTETQVDLFGKSEATRTLMGERIKVLDTALQQLRNDKRLFGVLAQNAEVIEQAGNILARAGNEKRKLDADVLAEIIEKLALKSGAVSDFLNRQAAAITAGVSRAEAGRLFLGDVQRVLEEDGLNALLSQKPRLAPEAVAEPGTPQSLATAEALLPASRSDQGPSAPLAAPTPAELHEGAPSLFDMLPAGRDAEGNLHMVDRAAALEDADRGNYLANTVSFCDAAA